MSFDPDQFLASTEPAKQESTFDPDKFLADTDPGIAVRDRLEAMHNASSEKPDNVARYDRLARKADVPYEVAKTIPDQVEKKISTPDWKAFVDSSPKSAKLLSDDPVLFQQTHDDVGSLQSIEQFRAELKKRNLPELKNNYGTGFNDVIGAMNETGDGTIVNTANPDANTGSYFSGLGTGFRESLKQQGLATQMMIGRAINVGDSGENRALEQYQMRQYSGSKEASRASDPAFSTTTGRMLYSGASSTVQNAPVLVAGLMNPVVGLALGAGQSGATQSGDILSRGGSTQEAVVGGALNAAVEAGTEYLPIGFASKYLGQMKIKDYIKAFAGREMVGEQAATVMQDAIDTAIANPDATWSDYWKARPEAALQTMFAVGVTSGSMGAAQYAANKYTGFHAAQDVANDLGSERDIIKSMKLAARNEQAARRVLDGIDGDEVQEVYIDPAQLFNQGAVDRSVFERAVPSSAGQIDEALDKGGLIRVNKNELLLGLREDDAAWDSVRQHVKVDPSQDSVYEATARIEGLSDELVKMAQDTVQKHGADSEYQADVDKTRNELVDMFNAGKVGDPAGNKTRAELWMAKIITGAEETGMKPSEFKAKYMPGKVTSNIQNGEMLNQGFFSDDPVVGGWAMLTQNEDVFRLPTSKQDTLMGILGEIEPGMQIKPAHESMLSTAQDPMIDGAKPDAAWEVKVGDKPVYVYENAGEVWVDVSKLKSGDAGSRIYNAVGNYAHNAGKVFIGDPAGLSDEAQSRRLEQMASSALKFGTTKHLRPHINQTMDLHGVPALQWQDGKDLDNMRAMLESGYEATRRQFPEVEWITFNPETRRFERRADGTEFTDADFRKLAGDVRAEAKELGGRSRLGADGSRVEVGGPITAGSTTLKRAVLTHALLRGESGERSRLLDELGRIGAESGAASLRGLLYQSKPPARSATPFPQSKTVEFGKFKTGEPVTFGFIHNTESATKIFGKPKKDSAHNRYIEPSGRYVSEGKLQADGQVGMISGELTFNNPLVLNVDTWKQDLFDHYGKRGKNLSQAIIADGHDGVVTVSMDDRPGRSHTSEILDLTTFDASKALYQGETAPRGAFSPETRDIALFARADLSTFLHETGHLFLEIQMEMASMENASDRIVKDTDTILKWFGVKGETAADRRSAWNNMTLNEKRKHHEKYAESFEQYLFEGKAPSVELRDAFRSFKAWLKQVYRSIESFIVSHDGAKLNDDVRSVFDRMLATEKQIQEAELSRGTQALFTERPEGVTDAEWESYRQAANESVQAAVDQLTARSLRDLKWIKNAAGTQGKLLRKMRREAAAARREARIDARRQILSQDIYRAMQFLTAPVDGVAAANKKAKQSAEVDPARDSLLTAIAKLGGLNKAQAVSQYGIDPKDFHNRKGSIVGKPVLRADGGLSPDAMAEALSQFGYLPLDDNGKWDIQDLDDMLREEAAGNPQYSTSADYDVRLGEPPRMAVPDAESVDFVGGRLSRQAIREMYDDADLAEMQGGQVDTEGKLLQEEKYKQDLFVAHNLTAENLIHAAELGGLAAPSLGISRTTTGGFDGYGEITLLADKEILTDRDARTFDADVYSPRHPRAQENISYGNYIDLVQRIKANQGEVQGLEFRVDHDSLMRNGAQDLANSEAFQNYYLVSKGIIIKPKEAKAAPAVLKAIKYLNKNAKHDSAYAAYNLREEDWFKALAEDHYKAEFEKWKNLRDDFTQAELVKYGPFEEDGSLKYSLYNSLALEVEHYHKKGGQDSAATRGAIAKHFRTDKGSAELQDFAQAELAKVSSGKQLVKYTKNGNQKRSAYTLENIVAEMTRELRGGEGFNYGAGSVRSAFAFEFKHNTIESIKSFKKNIVSKQEMDKVRDDANNKLSEALDKLAKFYKYDSSSWGYANDASSAIAEGPRGWPSAFKMTTESKKIITDLVAYLRNLPSEYFETKMQRAVGIGEFKTAVVPKGISARAMAILENNGLNVVTYDPKKEGARTAAIAKQKDILFQPNGKDSGNKRTLESMGVLSDEGLHPDTVADLFGLSSGDELVRALLTVPDPVKEIERLTDQIMLERHADLATPEAMADAVNAAIHSEARQRMVATELAMLNRAVGKPRMVMAAAKEYAARIVDATKIRDLRPARFEASESKAGREADAAMRKGKTADAALAKRNQILHGETVRQILEAKEEAEKAKAFFAKIVTASNKKNVTRGRDPDVVNAITAIVAQYGYTAKKEKSALEYLKLVEQYDTEMAGILKPAVEQAMMTGKPWQDMTVEELRGLRSEVESLWYLAKRSRQMEVDGKRLDIEDAAVMLGDRMREIGIPDVVPGEKSAFTPAESAMRSLQYAGAMLRRVEQWAEAKDGKWGGAFTRLIFGPIKTAADRYRTDRAIYRDKYRALIAALPDMKRGTIEAPELGYTFGKGEQKVGMAELLHAILHTGNDSNKRKLLLGRNWASLREDGSLDTGRWDAFISRLHKEGVLKKAHWDFAQGVWDLLEETKPLAQQTHREVFGRYFDEVAANGFYTPFGVYRGGYVPAQADPRLVQDASLRAMAEQENQNMSFAFPATAKGFTKARVEYNKPLMLDLRSLGQHIDKVLLFSHMEPAVRDVQRLLRRGDVSEPLSSVDPTAIDGVLVPWLNRAARQSVETPIVGDGKISRVASVVRSRAGMALMLGNVANTLQQLTGLINPLMKLKGAHMRRAAAQYLAGPQAFVESVANASPFMHDRILNEVSAINDQINDILLDPTMYEKGQAWAQKHAYFLQSALDGVIGPIVWTASYNQSVADGMSDADAVKYADSVVRTTQGSTLPEDVSRIETGPAYARLFTQFAGYFNMMANTAGTELVKISQDVGLRKGAGRALGVAFYGILAPLWVAEAIAVAMRGGPDDDDDDGYLDDWIMQVVGLGTVKGVLAGVPFVGQAALSAINRFNGNPLDDRISISPAISLIEGSVGAPYSVYKAIADEGDKRRAVMDVATLVSVVTGLPARPLARPVGYLAGIADDKIDPSSVTDFTRGVVTGVPSKDSKQR